MGAERPEAGVVATWWFKATMVTLVLYVGTVFAFIL